MKIKRIRLKNIRSYEDQEIIFPEGSVLLSGDVGSGKTTVLLAIEYALFGLQPGQRGSSLLRNNASYGEVVLEFEISDKKVVIERRLKKSAKTISNDYNSISINDQKIELSTTEIKSKILKLFGYPPEFLKKTNLLYRYTVYAPQEKMKEIILEDPDTRLDSIRHIFGIDKYKQIRDNIETISTDLKEKSKLLQGEIQDFDSLLHSLELKTKNISILENNIKIKDDEIKAEISVNKNIEFEVEEINKKLKEKEKFEKEAEKTKILLSTKEDGLSSTEKEYAEIVENISKFNKNFDSQFYDSILMERNNSKNKIEQLRSLNVENISLISFLNQKKQELKDKKERIFKINFCPTCLQNVPENHKHNILNESERELSEIDTKINSLIKEKPAMLEQIELEKKKLESIEGKKEELEMIKSRLNYFEEANRREGLLLKQKEFYEKDIILLKKHLDSLKEDILAYSKFNNLLKIKKAELNKAIEREKNLEISLAELKKELELSNNELKEITKKIKEKEEKRKNLINLLELQDWLTNQFSNLIGFIERNVLIKVRYEFSRLFNKWFHMIAGESFESQLDENFSPVIMQGGIEMEYSFLSGGERTAVALAYRLALNQTINSILSQIKTKDLVILDEPTEGFSETQINKIRDVFNELKINQLIIVSHEPHIDSFVDNVIKLKKEGEISVLDQQ